MYSRTSTIRKTLRSGTHTNTRVVSSGIGLTESVRGETGKVEIVGTIDNNNNKAEIEFRKEYVDPVVVAYIVTRGGGQSADGSDWNSKIVLK